jgi:putative glutamine amidotransferase
MVLLQRLRGANTMPQTVREYQSAPEEEHWRMNTRRPRIGITCGSKPGWVEEHGGDYRMAVEDAGGEAVFITPADPSVADTCDALLFAGGMDVHPSLYPRRPVDADLSDEEIIERYEVLVDSRRDAYELPLARRALQEERPVLGICRGFQIMNVAAGGSLVPDIQQGVGDLVVHRVLTDGSKVEDPDPCPLHAIQYEPDTLFGRLVGPGATQVNTYHHQGVTDAELASSLRAAAYADDGIIEALELPDHRFCLAVQFHPERRKDAEVHRRFSSLFAALVETAAKR